MYLPYRAGEHECLGIGLYTQGQRKWSGRYGFGRTKKDRPPTQLIISYL